jgi:hypothetical protein
MDELAQLLTPYILKFSQRRLRKLWKESFPTKPFPNNLCGYLLSQEKFLLLCARLKQEDHFADIWEYKKQLSYDNIGGFISYIKRSDRSSLSLIVIGNPTDEEIEVVRQVRIKNGGPQLTRRQARQNLIQYCLWHELRHRFRNDRAKIKWYYRYKVYEKKKTNFKTI